MLISRDQVIAGIPAVEARELMRAIREYAATAGYVAEHLDQPVAEARSILDELDHEGFVCPVEAQSRAGVLYSHSEGNEPSAPTEQLWATTIAGNALSKARIGKPMPRAKAKELLDGLVERATALNEDKDSTFTVEEVSVFGSYADPGDEPVGDVDIHVVFSRRVDGDDYIQRCLADAEEAERHGHRFSTFHDRLAYLEMSFRREIRGRSPRLDEQFTAADHEPRLPPGANLQAVHRVAQR